MEWDGHNRQVRVALDFPTGTAVSEHPSKVDGIRCHFGHTVTHVPTSDGLTCVPYAFGLAEDPVYQAIAGDFDDEIFAGREFVEWTLNERLHAITKPELDSLGMYFDDTSWRHVGIVTRPNRIASKWGTYPVYEHGFWEVPISYGNHLRFFQKPSREDAVRLFLQYAEAAGVSPEDIKDILAEAARAS